MKPIVIAKTGNTFPNIKNQYRDFENWIIAGMGVRRDNVQIFDIQKNEYPPIIESCGKIIITGSHSMVTENTDWIKRFTNWIKKAAELNIPILGICFGHQLLANALGGKVNFNPKGREIGGHKITLTTNAKDDMLFQNCPERMMVLESHQQSVTELPPKAKVLAYNDHEQYQAFVINNNIWGVQFHPEFNEWIMQAYIREQKEDLENEGFDVIELTNNLKHYKKSESIFKTFIEIV